MSEIEITAADREAAAQRWNMPVDALDDGDADVQAFAAHRIAARTAALEEVAAMIDGSDGMIPHSTVFVPVITGSNQPCMSGDGRDQLNPHRRRQFDDAAKTLATAIRALTTNHHKVG